MDDKALRAESQAEQALDFGILPELIGYHVRRAQLYLFADFARTMADVQITPGQFGVLSLVAANPGLTQSALARAVGIERSTMVAVIDALQGRDLVERRPSPVDRRSNALVLTEPGRAVLDRVIPMVRAHERRMARNLSADDRDRLIELLTRLVD